MAIITNENKSLKDQIIEIKVMYEDKLLSVNKNWSAVPQKSDNIILEEPEDKRSKD